MVKDFTAGVFSSIIWYKILINGAKGKEIAIKEDLSLKVGWRLGRKLRVGAEQIYLFTFGIGNDEVFYCKYFLRRDSKTDGAKDGMLSGGM
ncbi:hypothetical protein AGMMS49944_00610 [Spirochaetia bacterium]|nr:hypothetical protein AGMMS49944_00610 [Spirochaetia bacterium]